MIGQLKMQKPFFVGKRSLEIQRRQTMDRRLAGFVLDPGYDGACPEDCHLVIENGEIAGRVTSAGKSPVLQQIIGLAYVRPNQTKPGTRIHIRAQHGRMIEAVVTETPFTR